MRLIDAVKQKQHEGKNVKSYTHKQMAAILQMHEITWVNKANGKRPLSEADKTRIIKVWPDLIPLFLSENASKDNNPEKETTK